MRKLTDQERHLLRLIADNGGSYCPSRDRDPAGVRALHNLVKAKRLTVEPNDGAPPMHLLTGFGWEDARG